MENIRLWLAGDVMTGRGIDQVQAHPGNPVLVESWARDAREYVRLAEHTHGPVPAPVAPDYIWGDALAELARHRPDLRLVNLETAITIAGQPWPGKGVHYRMHPANIACLTAAGIDCCALANNHVLDWGHAGLTETLHTLAQAGIQAAGAGPTLDAACAPAALPLPGGGRLLVFSWAAADCGVPEAWGATPTGAGVALLPGFQETSARQVAAQVARHRRPGDLVVQSLHWGGNWGAGIPQRHRHLAHRLIDLGAADLVHGHSSHHPRPAEVHSGKLILYGCGDLINDYEGIASQEPMDPSAVCLYFATLARATGALQQLAIVPMQLRRLRLEPAQAEARHGLQALLGAEGRDFGTGLDAGADGSWQLRW